MNEDFDLSGYDKEVIVNKNRQYATNFKFYSQELNGHYSTTSISTIIQQSQSWLGNNFDALDAAGLVGNDRTITTGELMASDNPAAADFQADLISTNKQQYKLVSIDTIVVLDKALFDNIINVRQCFVLLLSK